MIASPQTPCTAFDGPRRLAAGPLVDVALQAKAAFDRGGREPVLIFHDETGETIEVNFSGTAADVRRSVEAVGEPPAPPEVEARGPGRPKLGVVAREVTLLPRHWDWLGTQPGGASVALRKLVDEARKANAGKDRLRRAQEAAYRFLVTMAGDRPGFEEATRALFAGQKEKFDEQSARWPADVRDHARTMAAPAFREAE